MKEEKVTEDFFKKKTIGWASFLSAVTNMT